MGTINFDFRSLYLHFENACWFCGCSAVADVRRDFDALFPVCREVTQEYADTRSLAVRGWDCVLRLFSADVTGCAPGAASGIFPCKIFSQQVSRSVITFYVLFSVWAKCVGTPLSLIAASCYVMYRYSRFSAIPQHNF